MGKIDFRIENSNNSLEKRCYQQLAKKIKQGEFKK